MPEPVRGHLIHLFALDSGGARQKLAALRDANITTSLSDLPGADPSGYGAAYPVPGLFSWAATASGLILLGDTPADRGAALQQLMSAQRTRAAVPVEIEYPDGLVEQGTALVSGIERRADYRDVLQGSYQLTGQGMLTEV